MRRPPFANYATVLGIGLLFYLFSFAIPMILGPHVEGVAKDIEISEWIQIVLKWYLISVTVCLALTLLWLYMSEHTIRIDWTGKHSQRSSWLIFLFFATVVVPGIGFGLVWPDAAKGGAYAFMLLFDCALIQFWIGTLIASPNPMAVAGGRFLRRRGF